MGGRVRDGGGVGLEETVTGGRVYFCRDGNSPFPLNGSRWPRNRNLIHDGTGANTFEGRGALLSGVSANIRTLWRQTGGRGGGSG